MQDCEGVKPALCNDEEKCDTVKNSKVARMEYSSKKSLIEFFLRGKTYIN